MRLLTAALALIVCCGLASPVLTGAVAASSPRVTFYFGLKRPEAAAQRAFFAVQQPGSPSYRHFLSVRQVAARYGAARGTRVAFVRAAVRRGLAARIDPTGVFARITGTVAQLDRVFAIHIESQFGNDPNARTWFVKGHGRVRLPADMRALVQDAVPTFAHSANAVGAVGAVARGGRAARRGRGADRSDRRSPALTGTWTRGCRRARSIATFSYGQVRHAYGIDRLGSGSGASVAILNLGEGVSHVDIAQDAQCFGYPKLAARTLLTDGQSHAFGYGTFEPEEDMDVIRGIAPGLTSLTFTQAWLSPELWFLGAAQVLDAPRLPDSFSISYGECERSIRGRGAAPTTRAGADLMDAMLVRLGIAGVGSYASAGDFGSTCNGRTFPGIAWPASSPYVTAVGGTRLTLDAANRRTDEVVWNDLEWLPAAGGGGAGGGGFSAVSRRPPFQRSVGITGDARTVPDVSALGSQFPGWPVVLAGNWVTDAGTSGSAPLVASAMAIVAADQRRRHLPPVGSANGLFYDLARHEPAALWDVVAGENTYMRGIRGDQAGRGYDLASGLGVPRFARVAADLPAPAG